MALSAASLAIAALLCLLSSSYPSSFLSFAWGYELPSFPSPVSLSFADHRVANGQQLPLSLTQVPPTLTWRAASLTRRYTLLITDPDAPTSTQPTMSPWLHYLHINVHGAFLMSRLSLIPTTHPRDTPGVLATYAPPSPPDGTGRHRYVLHVYQQSADIASDSHSAAVISDADDRRRARWGVNEWMAEQRAEGVELQLVAGMHFVVSGAAPAEQQHPQQQWRAGVVAKEGGGEGKEEVDGGKVSDEVQAPSELYVKGEKDQL